VLTVGSSSSRPRRGHRTTSALAAAPGVRIRGPLRPCSVRAPRTSNRAVSRERSMTTIVRPPRSPEPSDRYTADAEGAASSGPRGGSGLTGRTLERRRSPERRRRARREALLFGALIAPNLIAIIVFSYYPSLFNTGLSFFECDFVAPETECAGRTNYADLFTAPQFGRVLRNTLIFTGAGVLRYIAGGMLLGSLLATKVPLTGFAQTMAFAPHMLPGAAVGILWLFMFDPNYGLSRWLFSLFGADSPAWTTTSDWSLWAITIAYTWQRLGF